MNCLCGHGECCKYCSPYYKPSNDPIWLRERLAEAHALLCECAQKMGFEDTELGEKVLAWLEPKP